MNNPLISVIVPVYNVAPFLEKCIRSIINQTYNNLQIILVDDGSTDDSGKICDTLKNEDERICVIHQSNKGLSVARNVGMNHASGEWIAFLDSDDWLEPDAYEILLSVAINNNADISSCLSRVCEYGDVTPQSKEHNPLNVIIYDNIDEIIKELRKKERLRIEVWNKLWKFSLIENIRYVPGQVSEDVHFDRIAFLKASRIAHVDKVLHNYLVGRPGSTNSSFKMARFAVFDEYEIFAKELISLGHDEAASIIYNMAVRYSLNMYIEAVDKKQSNDTIKRIYEIFRYYYSKIKLSEYLDNAAKVFSISPRLYYMLSKIKVKIKR